MKSSKSIIGVMVLVCFFIMGTATIGGAQVIPKGDQWQSYVGTYFWLPAVTGKVRVEGTDADVNTSLSDTFSHIRFAASLHYEGFQNNWGIMFDGWYGKLEQDGSSPPGQPPGGRKVTSESTLVEVAIPYRIVGSGAVTDLFIGVRYNSMLNKISFEAANLDREKRKDFFDPFVGARVLLPISKEWIIGIRGDIGGFGISTTSSTLALNGIASINWQITPLVSLSAGYRAYYMKYDKDDLNKYDATSHGPWLGVGFSF
jgi:hypothetical protein